MELSLQSKLDHSITYVFKLLILQERVKEKPYKLPGINLILKKEFGQSLHI